MFARISFGWELVGQSFRVLREEKRLIVFPLLSGIACLLVWASFAIPLWGSTGPAGHLGWARHAAARGRTGTRRKTAASPIAEDSAITACR